jgi:RNA polymerase sigma factor (sigma-70 family)
MKAKYSPDVDILMVWLSEEPFDYAEEVDGVITHFSAAGKPVLVEIQGAKDFLVSSPSVQREEDGQVRRALQALPEEQRMVVILSYIEGYSQSQIAERLHIPLGTVKSRTRLALSRLRTELNPVVLSNEPSSVARPIDRLSP